jgi:hypothetical protein
MRMLETKVNSGSGVDMVLTGVERGSVVENSLWWD